MSESSKRNSDGVTEYEMPALFSLEWLCAILGLVFTALSFPRFYNNGVPHSGEEHALFPLLTGVAGLLVLLVAAWLAPAGTRNIIEYGQQGHKPACRRMQACSIACILGMAILIWMSGGVKSPILPLYVMTHTLYGLAISRCCAEGELQRVP